MEWIMTVISLLVFHTLMRFRKNYYKSRLIDISSVYDIMGSVINATNADRFLILYTTNGGGIPHIGGHLYGSVLYEYRNEKIPGVKEEFQKIPADQAYIDLLVNVERAGDKGVLLVTSEMGGSFLESIYRRDNITCSYIFKIKDTKSKYYYASVQTTSDMGILDVATIQMAAARIKTLFKNAK